MIFGAVAVQQNPFSLGGDPASMSFEGDVEEQSEWRAFELLVTQLESLLQPTGAVVKSPDMILDLETGDLREVDCSISTETESGIERISIECRRRRSKEDVTWIEQLSCKRTALGLKETIAVSSKGFSTAAYTKAQLHGITLKTYREAVLEIAQRPFALESLRTTTSLREISYEVFDDAVQPTLALQRAIAELIEAAASSPEMPILREIDGSGFATYQQLVDLATERVPAEPVQDSVRKFRLTFGKRTTFVGVPDETVLEALVLELSVSVAHSSLEDAVFGEYGLRDRSELQTLKTSLLVNGMSTNLNIVFQLVDVAQPAPRRVE